MISRQFAMQFETCVTILGGIFQEKILGKFVSGPSTSLTRIWGNLGFSNNGDLPFHKSIHLSKREKKLSGIISLNRKTKNLSHALIWMKTKLMKPLPNKWHISLHAVLSFLFCSTYFSPCGCFKFWLCASLCYLMRAISTDNVLCSSFCSDCLYQVLCFLVSLCSHSKQHQYGLLLVLFTSLCFDCVSLCSSSTHYQSSLPLLLLTSSQSSHLPRSAPDDFLHTTAHCFNKSLSSHLRYIKQVSSIGQLSKLLTKQLWAIPGKVLFKVSHGLEVVGAGWIKMGPSPSSTTDPCAPPVPRNYKSTNTQIQIQNAPTNTKAPIEINHHLRRTMRSKRNSLVSSELVCVCGAWLCDIQWKRNSKESNYDWCLCVIFLIL